MTAVLIIGLVLATLLLWSKLGEVRYQMQQLRHERDTYARIYEQWICADVARAGAYVPPLPQGLPDRHQ